MKKENKKKVVTLSAMAALLAVVLGMGGKTYAKYFTEYDVPAQTATVAKWGVVINTPDVSNLFGQKYQSGTPSATVTTGDSNIVVKGSTNKVAPGTSGNMSFTVTGLTEVKAQINVTVDFTKQVHLDTYYPMVWTIDGATNDYTSVDGGVNGAAADYTDSQVLNPGDDAAYSFSLNWNWAFSIDEATDEKDTELGRAAEALTTETDALSYNVAFTVSIEVVQLAA